MQEFKPIDLRDLEESLNIALEIQLEYLKFENSALSKRCQAITNLKKAREAVKSEYEAFLRRNIINDGVFADELPALTIIKELIDAHPILVSLSSEIKALDILSYEEVEKLDNNRTKYLSWREYYPLINTV